MTETKAAVHNVDDALLPHLVEIDELRTHPDNARRGDVDFIADRLQQFGQYQVMVADEQGVLAVGNHRWMAAKKLGWTHVAAIRRKMDEETARRLRLADNRSHDRGDYDQELLVVELQALPTLEGTGYDQLAFEGLLEATQGRATSPPGGQAQAPGEFPKIDDDLDTDFQCPGCGYEWSGNPKPNADA